MVEEQKREAFHITSSRFSLSFHAELRLSLRNRPLLVKRTRFLAAFLSALVTGHWLVEGHFAGAISHDAAAATDMQ